MSKTTQATPAAPPAPPMLVEIQSAFMPPAAIIKAIESIGIYKARQNYLRMFILAFMAGVFIAIGGMTSITFGKGIPNSDPGAQKFAYGAVFPVGLILVSLCGSELITGNFACLIPGLYNRKLAWYEVLIAWFIVYCGNFVGSLAMAYFLAYQTGLFIKDPWLASVQAMAETKVSMRFGQTFLSAMGCNFLVCLAIFMVTASKTIVCKVFVIWFPIMAFATIGFEHCVANMFLIPCGMLYGGNVTFGQFIGKNIVPVTLGNAFAAIFFVATIYWFIWGMNPRTTPAPPKPVVTVTEEHHSDDDGVELSVRHHHHHHHHHNKEHHRNPRRHTDGGSDRSFSRSPSPSNSGSGSS